MIRRWLPLLILLGALAALWGSGVLGQLSWANLGRSRLVLADWVAIHPVLSPIAYIALYTIVVALSVPQAAVLTIAGGLLFGTVVGGLCAVVGGTLGAIILFLVARHAVGDRGGAALEAIRERLRRDGFTYLLAIRLVPAFPFWLVNLAASLCGMRLAPYAAATLLGVMPATFVFASIGAGAGAVLARGEAPDLSTLFSPRVLGPLLALALLSLLPLAWRHWSTRHA